MLFLSTHSITPCFSKSLCKKKYFSILFFNFFFFPTLFSLASSTLSFSHSSPENAHSYLGVYSLQERQLNLWAFLGLLLKKKLQKILTLKSSFPEPLHIDIYTCIRRKKYSRIIWDNYIRSSSVPYLGITTYPVLLILICRDRTEILQYLCLKGS